MMDGRVYLAIDGTASAFGDAEPLIICGDNVLLGRSSADPQRHRILRTRLWGAGHFDDLDQAIARAPAKTLCVGLSPQPNAVLMLGQVCAIAIARGLEVEVVAPAVTDSLGDTRLADLLARDEPDYLGLSLYLWNVELGAAVPGSPGGVDPGRGMPVDYVALAGHLPPAARWSKLEMALAATLWRLWCRHSPVAFSRFCTMGATLHPLLADLQRYQAGHFPRVGPRGWLLSRVDELLLRQVSHEWSTPVRVFVKAVTEDPCLYAWLLHLGDLYVVARLLAWSRHSQGQIVERRREHPAAPAPMMNWSFRWHPGGERVLEALPSLDTAPPVAIGGSDAYDAEHPWVCQVGPAGPYVTTGRRSARRDA